MVVLFIQGTIHGQVFIWNGSTDDNFTTNANWAGNNDPSGNVNGQIIFGDEGGGNHIINAQNGNLKKITAILFTNADGAYLISGTGSFQFDDGSTLLNDSVFLQTINVDLIGRNNSLIIDALAGALTFNGSINLSNTGGVELIVQGGNNTIISGIISGNNGSITMNGTGILILSGANTFTGPMVINSGTVQLDGSLANTISVTLANIAGATLDLNGNSETIGSLAGGGGTGGNVTLGAGTLTINENGTSTYGGVISGTGGLTMGGTGTLTLSGVNTFTGPMTINSGTVQLDGNLANTVSVTLANIAGATLNLNGNNETIGSLAGGGATGGNVTLGAGTLTINENGVVNYSGVISGTGGLTMGGTGTLTLSGVNTFTGPLAINSGTVQLDGDLANTVSVTLANIAGATLNLNGNNETIGSLAGGGATGGNVTLGVGTLTINENGTSTYGGVISGTGGLTMGGTGTLTLSGVNTFTGPMTINSGTLQLDGSLANTVVVTLANVAGAGLNLNGNDETIGSLTGSGATGGNVALGVGTLTINENGTATYGGVISGTGGMTMGGNGTLTLSGVNTFTGALAINSGTVQLDGSLANMATVTLANVAGATLNLNGNDETIGSLAGGGATGGNVTLGGGSLTITENGTSTYGGVISGTGGLTMGGTGTLTLSGVNTFTGPMAINSGTLQLDGELANTVSVMLANIAGTTLDLNGNDETIGSLAGGGATGGNVTLGAGTLTINENGTSTYGGVISGTGGLTMGGTGTLALSGVNTFTGPMAINSGILQLDGDLVNAVSVTLANIAGATLDLNGNDETIGSLSGGGGTGGNVTLGAATLTFGDAGNRTYAGVISGTGGIVYDGTGTLTLSGTNTFTGTTTINDGVLVLDGAVGGDMLVNTGSQLSGIGSVGGNLTLASGAIITPGSPGGSLGTLILSGDYVQQTGSTLRLELDGSSGLSDLLDISGTATLASGSAIDMIVTGELFISDTDAFTIIEADGGITDNGAVITTNSATLNFQLQLIDSFMNGDSAYVLEAVRTQDAFAAASDPGNNAIIGAALDAIVPIAEADPTGEIALLIAQLDALDAEALNVAESQLSPELYNATTSLGINEARTFNAIQAAYLSTRRFDGSTPRATRPDLPPGALASASNDPNVFFSALRARDEATEAKSTSSLGGYSEAIGVYNELKTESNRTGYTATTFGGQAGIDYAFTENLLAGFSLAFFETEADLNEDRGTIDVESIRFGPYVGYSGENWNLAASFSTGFSTFDSRRNIPALGRTARSEYDGYDLTGYVEAEYWRALAANWSIAPAASLQYSYFHYDRYTESGAGGANLQVSARSTDSFLSRLGLRLRHEDDSEGQGRAVELYAGWEHEFLQSDEIEASFAGGGGSFSIRTGGREEESIFFGAILTSSLTDGGNVYFRLEGDYSDGSYTLAAVAGFSLRF